MKDKKLMFKLTDDGTVEITDPKLLSFVSGGQRSSNTLMAEKNVICSPNKGKCVQNAHCTDD